MAADTWMALSIMFCFFAVLGSVWASERLRWRDRRKR
jgi:hypothetical protein